MTGAELIEQLIDASPDALVVVSEDGTIEQATAAVGQMFGFQPSELVGRPIDVLIPDRLHGRHSGDMKGFWEDPRARAMGAGVDLRAVRRDGTEFPVDVSLVPVETGTERRVGAFVRDATDRRRAEDLLKGINEISRITLEGWDVDGVLALAARRARLLVGAAVAWIAIRQAERITVAAADGVEVRSLQGATIPAQMSLAARVMADGGSLDVADMSADEHVLPEARELALGPGIYLPMLSEDGPVGALVLARSSGGRPFSSREKASAEVFASAAAIVLALGEARQAVEEAHITVEHERIARDLHDTVIQRLFALGMKLQATERLAQEPVRGRIGESVDAIDDVIRDIRETIFDLGRPAADAGVRAAVKAVVAEAEGHLGFSPRLAFRGPVEAALDDGVVADVVAVVREGLANVSRHAAASRADVVVTVDGGVLWVSVSDDGTGSKGLPSAGRGLGNMAARAAGRGGTVELVAGQPTGSVLSWRVPVT